MWAVANICFNAKKPIALKAIEEGGLEVIKEYLGSTDVHLTATLLRSLENLFERCADGENKAVEKFEAVGGMKVLELLQLNPNVAIYKMVIGIFAKYVQCEETTLEAIRSETTNMEVSGKL